jgi:hypothetical protein
MLILRRVLKTHGFAGMSSGRTNLCQVSVEFLFEPINKSMGRKIDLYPNREKSIEFWVAGTHCHLHPAEHITQILIAQH